jgi:hypothetical protein
VEVAAGGRCNHHAAPEAPAMPTTATTVKKIFEAMREKRQSQKGSYKPGNLAM